MKAAELHTALREVVAIGRRGGYDNDEIAANLARVVKAHSRDAVVAVLNEARAVVERETSDYPDASAAVTSGIAGGFDQWAAGRIEELGGLANEIKALQRSCPNHPGPLPMPSCPECARNGALVAAARLVENAT